MNNLFFILFIETRLPSNHPHSGLQIKLTTYRPMM